MRKRWLQAALLAGVCGACAPSPAGEDTGKGVLFLTQTEPAREVMQALYQGVVAVDSGGCVRLAGPDAHTVVWPHGFRLIERGGEWWVRDETAARDIGRLGGSFKLGGGEIVGLHAGIGVNGAAEARTRCPGRFWIVGDVPR